MIIAFSVNGVFFEGDCDFGKSCVFGDLCTFGERCYFEKNIVILVVIVEFIKMTVLF